MEGNRQSWQTGFSETGSLKTDKIASLAIWVTFVLFFLENLPSFKAIQTDREGPESKDRYHFSPADFWQCFCLWYYLIREEKINNSRVSVENKLALGFCRLVLERRIFEDFSIWRLLFYIFLNLSYCGLAAWTFWPLSLSSCMQFSSRAAKTWGDGAGRSIRQCHHLLQRHCRLHVHVRREYTATGTQQSIRRYNPPMDDSNPL